MFRLLFIFSTIFTISSCDFNESLLKVTRNKRQNNLNYECGTQYLETGLISGGSQVQRGEFPWLVAILHKRSRRLPRYICSGTLISSTKVVTAAHCIQAKHENTPTSAREIILLFGAHDLDDPYETDRTTKSPLEIIIHHGWNPFVERFTDDIAVLVLDKEIQFTNYIRPVCLSSEDLAINNGVVVAWGKDDKSEREHENIPKKLKIPITPNEDCYRENSKLAEISWPKSFCAGHKSVGVCRGDSGGGFFVRSGKKYYFKGLVSSGSTNADNLDFGTDCFTTNFAIYTDAVKYSEFIGVQESSCGVMSSDASLIIRGKTSSRELFPWFVSIFKYKDGEFRYFGTGSLVSSKHIVTKADTVAWPSNDGTKKLIAVDVDQIKIFLKSTNYNDYRNSKVIDEVAKISIHPQAIARLPRIYNVAVITLKEPLQFSSSLSPVCLWDFNNEASKQAGLPIYAVGNEYVQESWSHTGFKRYLKMTIVDTSQCSATWGQNTNGQFFCSIGDRNTGLASYDDPLYMKIENKWYLRGMMNNLKVTKGNVFLLDKPALIEDVENYLEWIKYQIKM